CSSGLHRRLPSFPTRRSSDLFFQELFHVLLHIFTMAEADLVLMVLSLIDLTLVGSLMVMVMFSGYENFVSRIDVTQDVQKLEWLDRKSTRLNSSHVKISYAVF